MRWTRAARGLGHPRFPSVKKLFSLPRCAGLGGIVRWLLGLLVLGCGGCDLLNHVTCAPKLMVEACLQEAHGESNHTGLGPYCNALNDWAKAHRYAFGGGPPIVPPPPSPQELLKENP